VEAFEKSKAIPRLTVPRVDNQSLMPAIPRPIQFAEAQVDLAHDAVGFGNLTRSGQRPLQ
jgi:acetoacetate decarboxylase